MGCGCGRVFVQYVWTPPAGSGLKPVTYNSEIEAKAKVMRKGGTYEPRTRG